MIRYDQCRKCQGTDLSVIYDIYTGNILAQNSSRNKTTVVEKKAIFCKDVDIEKKNGKITVNGKFIPIVTHYNRTDGDKFRFDVYKLSDYTDELAKSHSQKGGTPEYYNKLVKKVIDEKYLDLSQYLIFGISYKKF